MKPASASDPPDPDEPREAAPARDERRERPPPTWLTALSVAAATLFAIPFVYLVVRNISPERELLSVVASRDTFSPLVGTLWLATSVSVAASAVGTALAWLTMRTDLRWRPFWRVACPLPLVLPSFIAASALAAYGPGGLPEELLGRIGLPGPPRLTGFAGSFLVLTAISYPYVYLPVAARLGGLSPSLEEASRLLGYRAWPTFWRVVWPQLRAAVRAGGLLVFLYVVSDFGVVWLMGYQTLTTKIFSARLADTALAFALGLVLALVALAVVAGERLARGDRALSAPQPAVRPVVVHLGRWRPVALLALLASVGAGLGAPVLALLWWAYRGFVAQAAGFGSTQGLGALVGPTWHTVSVSVAAAVISVAVVLPVALLTGRHPGRLAASIGAVVVAGFALPGLVVALSMVFLALNVPALGALYQTLPLLLLAYVVHFGAQAYRAAEVGVASADERLAEAARSLGAGRWRRLWRVELPLMAPPLAAGGGLVMLSTMKELPATLLAAPFGWDTLATRVWNANEGGFLADAAAASLLLVAVSAALTWLLVIRRAEHLR